MVPVLKQQRSSVPNDASKLKMLSRNALYTPIEAYSSPSANARGQTLTRNLEKKLREKNLFSFLEEVSATYHGPTSALGVDGGNHNSRTKNIIHFQRNLAQRALTLIGGGIGTPLARSATSLVDRSGASLGSNGRGKRKRRTLCGHLVHGAFSKRKRTGWCVSVTGNGGKKTLPSMKSIHLRRAEDGILGRVSSPRGNTVLSDISRVATNTLIGLNEIWINYIKILLRDHIPLESKNFKSNEIALLLSSAELVGAFVKIEHCASHSSYCGMSGFIVDISANTWKVAVLPKGIVCEFGEECMEGLRSRCRNKSWKVITVPKRRSTLDLGFPFCITSELPSNVSEYCCITISGDL